MISSRASAERASAEPFDLIVIGSGPGGASLAHRLAPSGKRILLLERGGYLPRAPANWDAKTVFVDGAYQAPETWYGGDGKTFHPGLHYYVGGNSKVYGAALFRLRERDFEEVRHAGGLSPAWPLGYADFAPWYDEAERLYAVHGTRGEDPTEPPATSPFPHPAVTHDPLIESLSARLAANGLHPFHLPLGIRLTEKDGQVTSDSPCIRCQYFDGFPCPLGAKADAQVMCVDPALAAHPNLTLVTEAYVERLETDATGRRVTGVHVTHAGREERYTGAVVVVACGALSSALLLLRSRSERHPDGLANGSGLVGCNYLRHNQSVLMAVTRERSEAVFQKTLAVSDYHFESDAWAHPLGLVQMMATSHSAQIRAETLPGWLEWLPDAPFAAMARHSLDFWMSSEDLPRPENRIRYDGKRVVLALEETNMEAHHRLVARWKEDVDRTVPLDRGGEPDADDHRQRAARGRSDRRAALTEAATVSAPLPPWLDVASVLFVAKLCLVVLFPFSALDKILYWRDALKQARSSFLPGGPVLLILAMAVELATPLCILLGFLEWQAALLLAAYCLVTALLYHRFWACGDFWAPGESVGRTHFWDFLKNIGLVGGLILLVLYGSAVSA